jgi:hypothetical protein
MVAMVVFGLCGNNREQFLHTLDNQPEAEHSCGRGSKKGGGSTNGRERLAEVVLPMLREALDHEAAINGLEPAEGVTHDAET